MEPDLLVTTFPTQAEFQRALPTLKAIGGACRRIDPPPAFSLVAAPALIMNRETRSFLEAAAPDVAFSGWVDYRPPQAALPDGSAPEEAAPDECFRRAAIMVLAPCIADDKKIRLIAHIEGNLGPVLPYLNAVLPQASYTPAAETLTFMDGYRMIALYPGRITIAKADDIVDAWMTLEKIRLLVVKTWGNRTQIKPSFQTRKKPPAWEIFKRLPGINCGKCGEPACLAFAMRVWTGELSAKRCLPVFEEGGQFSHFQDAVLEICAGMGITDSDHG